MQFVMETAARPASLQSLSFSSAELHLDAEAGAAIDGEARPCWMIRASMMTTATATAAEKKTTADSQTNHWQPLIFARAFWPEGSPTSLSFVRSRRC